MKLSEMFLFGLQMCTSYLFIFFLKILFPKKVSFLNISHGILYKGAGFSYPQLLLSYMKEFSETYRHACVWIRDVYSYSFLCCLLCSWVDIGITMSSCIAGVCVGVVTPFFYYPQLLLNYMAEFNEACTHFRFHRVQSLPRGSRLTEWESRFDGLGE